MKFLICLISCLTLLLSCSESTGTNYNDEFSLIENLNIKQSIAKANEWRTIKPKITSYVTTNYLIFEFPDGKEIKKTLPDDEMYIAVAPYINNTHSCTNHYISTCDAELKNKEFNVKATIDNNVILNEKIQSLDNGFIEIWLPRNKEIILQVNYINLKAIETIITNNDSRTCFTTFKLE